ncbi:unnamed protein product [Ilex paraguariensis]|uniref:Sec-independent protein translocase protein TATB, chloroplastic n=1 Tax=Ilex paraguariensis TaxID=185542 RepID=A0ABC8UVJ0_9AQUA
MASAISAPTYLYSSSLRNRKPTLYRVSTTVIRSPKTTNFPSSTCLPQLGFGHFSPWNGLRHLGISISSQSVKIERKVKCKGKGVFASLFGVGAPEALVIGVVALLVFGPKGLAEVARNLGKTLRAFQPTIKELQEVSREFKSTLEREIGLDDIQSSVEKSFSSTTTNTTSSPSSIATSEDSRIEANSTDGSPSPNKAYSSEEYLKITEEQLKASVAPQQTETASIGDSQTEPQSQSQDIIQESAAVMPLSPTKKTESEI